VVASAIRIDTFYVIYVCIVLFHTFCHSDCANRVNRVLNQGTAVSCGSSFILQFAPLAVSAEIRQQNVLYVGAVTPQIIKDASTTGKQPAGKDTGMQKIVNPKNYKDRLLARGNRKHKQ